ncbi:hypothetical protein JTZ62_04690 [Mammaliicoccus sciuri]|uniref:hypothetical protein n=1 Tax=Mammaliicoccus sciuri TaxID=1296 RepID=UPI0019D322E9|nr:hypothetical protein [Mammaliicoccus sciuri]QSN68456.1 hypothetical protein JTZ62_04690 [Mammaliicoccus sciuri]UIU23198.1 hypothetical protein LLZ87_04705 [Mammaliicoccus sciuri]UIU26103.1 hypothetical protein LLZ92_04705 [Mammaliicoccus sciuri]
MWEIYTLYMINEDEKVAVSYYTDRSPVHLKNDGEKLLNILLDFDRYIILGMGQKQIEEKLKGYKIIDENEYEYEYDKAQPSIRGMKLELIK